MVRCEGRDGAERLRDGGMTLFVRPIHGERIPKFLLSGWEAAGIPPPLLATREAARNFGGLSWFYQSRSVVDVGSWIRDACPPCHGAGPLLPKAQTSSDAPCWRAWVSTLCHHWFPALTP